jgi:hypothetical protein
MREVKKNIQILDSLARAYKSLSFPGMMNNKTSSFESCGLPARATLTATLESRGRMTPRGCKAVPGSRSRVYLTEEIRREASIPGERCLRRKGPAGSRRAGAAPTTDQEGLSQPSWLTRCPCRAGSPLFLPPEIT